MAKRFRAYGFAAGGLAALSCALLLGGARNGAAQSTSPSQYTAGSSHFLTVPLVHNIPGDVGPPPAIKNPVANDPAAAERGMTYFAGFNCVGCHAPNGAGGMGPSFSTATFKYGDAPENLFLVISHGAPLGMPAWGSVLPEQTIWDLVAYIESISKPPVEQWGVTISPAAGLPDVEQVPAEFKQTATPWQFTQPFANGNAPSENAASAADLPAAPGSGSSVK